MRSLITGGAGYVGSVLSEMLLSLGHEVTLFDVFRHEPHSVLHLLRRGVELVKGDVRDPAAVEAAVRGHDNVFHLAALVGFPVCDKYPQEAREVIVEGTNNVLRSLTPSHRLLYASTGSVYGRIESVCSEDIQPNPTSLYGRLKYEAEVACLEAGGVALRFATLFGVSPCMRFDLLPNAFVWMAAMERYIVLYRGQDRRAFLHVDDACRAFIFALERYEDARSQAFNVGWSDLNLTKRELAAKVQEMVPCHLIEREVANDPESRDYYVDCSRFLGLGFEPRVSLEAGLSQVHAVASIADFRRPWRLSI